MSELCRSITSDRQTHLEGDAREAGAGGTDCAGPLHTPDCDTRDGEGHTHWHASRREVKFSSLVSPW